MFYRKSQWVDILGRFYVGILLVILGGVVLHAPLSVFTYTIIPESELLVKSWKEILMLVAGVIVLMLMILRREGRLLRDPILMLIALYATLHIALVPFLYGGLLQTLAGLMIDLRFVLYFGLVYLAIRLFPVSRQLFIKVALGGAGIVVIFALMQIFVLPIDILKHIGYGPNTILPYLTVDMNYDFIRINSTLRGPNPLGAYSMGVVTVVASYLLIAKGTICRRNRLWLTALAVGALVTLVASYSRSAAVALVVGLGFLSLVVFGKRLLRPKVVLSSLAVILALGFAVGSNSYLMSNIILHDDPNTTSERSSNDEHLSSLSDAADLVSDGPFGYGVGTTGSASLYGDQPLIIENQYLATAHEVGWVGLGIFLVIFGYILRGLWAHRRDPLALGLLASGIGMAVIGLVLPVWTDDTVSIVWWGLAALALASVKSRSKDA
jgi:hypothetical protein